MLGALRLRSGACDARRTRVRAEKLQRRLRVRSRLRLRSEWKWSLPSAPLPRRRGRRVPGESDLQRRQSGTRLQSQTLRCRCRLRLWRLRPAVHRGGLPAGPVRASALDLHLRSGRRAYHRPVARRPRRHARSALGQLQTNDRQRSEEHLRLPPLAAPNQALHRSLPATGRVEAPQPVSVPGVSARRYSLKCRESTPGLAPVRRLL